MTLFPRIALLAGLAAGIGALAPAAQAAMPSASPMLGTALAVPNADLLEDVRYVNRCSPRIVNRRDRFGRPVQVRREVCRRVWVGRGR